MVSEISTVLGGELRRIAVSLKNSARETFMLWGKPWSFQEPEKELTKQGRWKRRLLPKGAMGILWALAGL